ncbi:MAG: MFS transporter [Negativicutes bacterium]|nr:MFS transporter [Negativicutes bacterium]
MSEQKQSCISKPLALLALSHMFTDLSQGALPILLPLFKTSFGLTYAQIGIIVLAQNFTSSVIQPVFGYLTDRLSLPWLVPAGLLVSGLGMAITGLASSYEILLLIVIFTGLGIAAFHPQGSKGAHAVSPPHLRGQSMAVFSVGGNLGNAFGSIFMTILLTLPGLISNTVYFCLPAALLAGLLWLNLSQISPPPPARASAGTKAAASQSLPYAMIIILLVFIFIRSSIQAGLTTYIPLYYADYLGGSHLYAGYLLSVFLLSGAVGTFIGGTLSDRLGRKTVLLGSMVLTFPLLWLLPYTSGLWTLALMAVTGMTLIASFAATVVLAQEMMPGYEASAASLTIGFSIGMGGVGATLLGFVADSFGVPSVFSVIALLPVMSWGLIHFLPGKLFRRDTIPAA